MVKVIGRSGVELELDEGTAASLVEQGVATYADSEPTGGLQTGGLIDDPQLAMSGDGGESETVVPVSDVDDADDELADEGQADEDEDQTGMPAESDNKATWVEYACKRGARFNDAKAMTKADLVAQYGRGSTPTIEDQSDEGLDDTDDVEDDS